MDNHILYVPIKCADFLLAKATHVNQREINRVGAKRRRDIVAIYDVIVASKGKCSVEKLILMIIFFC